LLDRVVDYFEDMAEQHKESSNMVPIPRRGYELVAKVSMLLGIPEGVRTAEHVRLAFAVVKRDVEEKIRLAQSNSEPDRGGAMAAKMLSLVSTEHGETIGRLKNKMRAYRPEDVQKMADSLVQAGRLKQQEVAASRSGGRKTLKYYLIS